MICSEKRNNFIKITAMILAAVLMLGIVFAMFPARAEAAGKYSTIRVRLNISGSSQKVTVKGNYTVKEDSSIELKSGKTYTVAVSSGKIRISGNGVDETLSSVTFVRGKNKELSDGLLKIGSYSYLGNIRFTVSGSSVRAINTIDLEQYLYGVVAAEMGNGFPLEALKAQAICARCYAILKIDEAGSSDSYDIIGTSSEQAYKGYNASYTRVIEAVDATKGQVLMSGNEIIEAYFTASNGGQTESAGNAWGGGAAKDAQYPYLTVKKDQYDLDECSKNSSYEQTVYMPKDPTGERTKEGRYSNAALNDLQEMAFEKLKDEHGLDKVSDIKLITINSIKNGDKRYPSSKSSASYVNADAELTVQLPDETEATVNVTLVLMKKSGSSYSLTHDYLNGKFRLRYIAEKTHGWYICNRRYGHGVGLSQMGAKNMDEKHSMDYKEILAFYYPGTKMKTLETGGAETDPDDSQDEVPGYEIGDSFVTGIEVGTKTGDFLEKMNAGGGAYKLYAAKTGKEKADGEVVTGDIVEDSAGKQRYAVIYGDLNGDGEIALTDLLREQKYILEILKLDEAFKEAADATRDGVVNIADLLRIQKHLLGVTEIAQ